MKLLVDNQLPLELVRWLERHGVEACHVLDLGLNQSSDTVIWDRAVREGWAMVTKDEDFTDWVWLRKNAVPVVWVRLGNCRNEELLAAFESSIEEIIRRLQAGDMLIEVY